MSVGLKKFSLCVGKGRGKPRPFILCRYNFLAKQIKPYYYCGKLRELKICSNHELRHDLRPCIRAD